jgi:hypothetical protein
MRNRHWALPFATIVFPILSTVAVAVITSRTNTRVAEIQRAVEQDKLRAQEVALVASIRADQKKREADHEMRRQAFLESNMPRLLKADEAEVRLGTALIRVVFPDDAERVFATIAETAGDSTRGLLQEAERRAQAVTATTGTWSIVISGDKSLDLARKWRQNAAPHYTSAAIYQRDGFYRVAVGDYPTREAAEEALDAVRSRTRSDAYIVAPKRWCLGSNTQRVSGTEIIVCSASQ